MGQIPQQVAGSVGHVDRPDVASDDHGGIGNRVLQPDTNRHPIHSIPTGFGLHVLPKDSCPGGVISPDEELLASGSRGWGLVYGSPSRTPGHVRKGVVVVLPGLGQSRDGPQLLRHRPGEGHLVDPPGGGGHLEHGPHGGVGVEDNGIPEEGGHLRGVQLHLLPFHAQPEVTSQHILQGGEVLEESLHGGRGFMHGLQSIHNPLPEGLGNVHTRIGIRLGSQGSLGPLDQGSILARCGGHVCLQLAGDFGVVLQGLDQFLPEVQSDGVPQRPGNLHLVGPHLHAVEGAGDHIGYRGRGRVVVQDF